MATLDQILYYQNLLIIQYLTKPKAFAHIGALASIALLADSNVQLITFNGIPASGTFTILYNGSATSAIAWNASAATIQSDVTALLVSPLSVTVTGSVAAGLTFTFAGYASAVQNLSAVSSLLSATSVALLPVVTPIGTQLPIEILNGFNVTGDSPAVGVQLDTLGKYVGVTRSGFGFSGPITLDDDDFRTLIQIAIIRSSSGSSLETIQALLNQFFNGEIYVFDYANMNMSYLIDTAIGSQDLVQLFVTEGLLPRPMGVGISVVAAPVIDQFFGFVTYDSPVNPLGTPFNTYDSYSNVWQWVSYDDAP